MADEEILLTEAREEGEPTQLEEAPPTYDIPWQIITKLVINGEPYHPIVVKAVEKLSEIVYNTHFSWSDDKVDLLSEGRLKAYRLMIEGRFDEKKNLKNYLYTGMRNEMHNWLYKIRRDVSLDDDFEAEADRDIYESIKVEFSTVCQVLGQMERCYHKYLTPVLDALEEKGFRLLSVPVDARKYEEGVRYRDATIERLVCMVIWNKLEEPMNPA